MQTSSIVYIIYAEICINHAPETNPNMEGVYGFCFKFTRLATHEVARKDSELLFDVTCL